MTAEEVQAARQMLEKAARLSNSEFVVARRAGERITAILGDLLYEYDPAAGLPEQS